MAIFSFRASPADISLLLSLRSVFALLVLRPHRGWSNRALNPLHGLLLRLRDDTELAHQAQGVVVEPTFLDLAVGDAPSADPLDRDPFAGRRDTHQITRVGGVSPKARHHLVPFGDLILDGVGYVGEGAAEHDDELLGALKPAHLLWGTRIVEDVLGLEDLIHQVQVSAIEDLVEVTANDGFVYFRHALPPSRHPSGGVVSFLHVLPFEYGPLDRGRLSQKVGIFGRVAPPFC